MGIATALAFLLAGDSLYGESPSTTRQLVLFVWICSLGDPERRFVRRPPRRTLGRTPRRAAGDPHPHAGGDRDRSGQHLPAVMIHAKDSFTVVRDTLFAVIMIIIEHGMVGASLPARRLAASRAVLQLAGRQYLLERDHSARGAQPDHAELHANHARADAVASRSRCSSHCCASVCILSSWRCRRGGIAATFMLDGEGDERRPRCPVRLERSRHAADRVHGAGRLSRRAIRPADRRRDRNIPRAGRAR